MFWNITILIREVIKSRSYFIRQLIQYSNCLWDRAVLILWGNTISIICQLDICSIHDFCFSRKTNLFVSTCKMQVEVKPCSMYGLVNGCFVRTLKILLKLPMVPFTWYVIKNIGFGARRWWWGGGGFLELLKCLGLYYPTRVL